MQNVLDDLKYLSKIYNWSPEDKKEIWEASKNNDAFCSYWQRLATSHRSGYQQNAENHFIRLDAWEALQLTENKDAT